MRCLRLAFLSCGLVVFCVCWGHGSGASTNSTVHPCEEFDSLVIAGISFQGLKHTKPWVVQRALAHHTGEVFRCFQWEEEKTKLEGLDIFSDISLCTSLNTSSDTGFHSPRHDTGVLLNYAFKEMPAYIPFVSISKTDQDGFSLGPALVSLNFLGRDVRLEILSLFGGTTEYQASVGSPWFMDWPVEYDLAFIGVDSYNALDDFHETSFRSKLDLTYPLSTVFGVVGGLEVFRISDGGRGLLLSNGGEDLIPRIGVGVTWDTRNALFNPTRGLYQEMRWSQSGGFLGGPADFSEYLADVRFFVTWLPRNTFHLACLYRYRTGLPGRDIGFYDDFHLGGGNTLRGFSSNSIHGKNESIGFLENRYTLMEKRSFSVLGINAHYALQAVLGVEAGSAWNTSELRPQSLRTAWYTGFHILTGGIDRIRLELGSKSAKLDLKFDLGIMEKTQVQRFRTR